MQQLLIVVGIIMILQFFTGIFHIKYYQRVLRKMSKRSEGFLGVGMNQRKFKLGQVCIIVTDPKGVIEECRLLSGMTIFSRFRKEKRFEGQSIFQMDWIGMEKWREVAENAIGMIQKEMEKKESVEMAEATKTKIGMELVEL
ncbi:transcriptional regulator GutM [Niallia oryzisoli]|uniref:transcriptional regulator GutM n=1 Tax=Niallia oryzisoli TaxID=1737571 RepID=UPI003736DAC9